MTSQRSIEGWLVLALIILGAIIYFFQALYQLMVPLSIITGVLGLLCLIGGAATGSEDLLKVGAVLLGVAILFAAIAYVAFHIGYNFGNTTIGNASKTFFDLYTHPLGSNR